VNGQPTVDDSNASLMVEAARDGDRSAFGRLYDQFAPMVHGILLARVPPVEVDDLVQDVFLLAFTRIHALRKPDAFGGWLAAITRNRAIDYHRRPREVAESLDQEVEDTATPGRLEDGEGARILALIRTLPEAYRETLILRLVEGMTGLEIAARTGLKPGSVRVNLHRGMQQLREKLDEQGFQQGTSRLPLGEGGSRSGG
jgi:RNA polymerase sigma-70 factor, ECF subfamily